MNRENDDLTYSMCQIWNESTRYLSRKGGRK